MVIGESRGQCSQQFSPGKARALIVEHTNCTWVEDVIAILFYDNLSHRTSALFCAKPDKFAALVNTGFFSLGSTVETVQKRSKTS